MKIYYGHEILNDFTKEEIIEFLRRRFSTKKLFRRSELLFVRWDLQSKELFEKSQKLNEESKNIDKNTPEGYKKWLENAELATNLSKKLEKVQKILEESLKAARIEEKS